MSKNINPILRLDYPDPDIIRVGDTYYMVTTTMHFMPGCEILRSYDLVNWEHATYVYDMLDGTSQQRLKGKENAYGKGMWAASIRYHKGIFYVCFIANDTGKTYLYTASDIHGPWAKRNIEGFYHDCSLFFEEERVFIVYGNKDIYMLELKADLSAPLAGGLNRLIVSDSNNSMLGYEGTHFYKINGKYYVFFIHSLPNRWHRVQACFVSDSLEGTFVGRKVLDDDMGYCDQGVAQGGIVDTPDGNWYGILFQDRGAVGRIPVMIPVTWQDDFPVFGENGHIPEQFEITSTRPYYVYRPLVQSDDFKGKLEEIRAVESAITEIGEKNGYKEEYGCFGLKSVWQFNHEPELSLVHCNETDGILRITTGKLSDNLTQARNTLTQRMLYPGCEGVVTVDAEGLKEGDFAGICALQGCYGMVALAKRGGNTYVVMRGEKQESEAILISNNRITLKVRADFTDMKDEAEFFYHVNNEWKKIGITQKLHFRLDHFTGCRIGLFLYSTIETGGYAEFENFIYHRS